MGLVRMTEEPIESVTVKYQNGTEQVLEAKELSTLIQFRSKYLKDGFILATAESGMFKKNENDGFGHVMNDVSNLIVNRLLGSE